MGGLMAVTTWLRCYNEVGVYPEGFVMNSHVVLFSFPFLLALGCKSENKSTSAKNERLEFEAMATDRGESPVRT